MIDKNSHPIPGKSELPNYQQNMLLQRTRLTNSIITATTNSSRPIFIEAQAGQGKSTLVKQFIEMNHTTTCLYQFTSMDKDPVYFLYNFYKTLTGVETKFNSELLFTMISKQEINSNDIFCIFKQLIIDLDLYLNKNLYLIFEDLHLLVDNTNTTSLISLLIDNIPKKCHVIITSRHSIKRILNASPNRYFPITINNFDLSLSHNEIVDLFNLVFQITISNSVVQFLYDVTEGWIMGLVLFGKISQHSPDNVFISKPELIEMQNQKYIFDYLLGEVFSHFTKRFRQVLIKLAILPQPYLRLVLILGFSNEEQATLSNLISSNFFMHFPDSKKDKFVFHSLFKLCLKDISLEELTLDERNEAFLTAANWYLTQNLLEPALHCLLKGEFYAEADQAFQNIGISLHANNRLISLQTILNRLPDDIIRSYGWLSYFYGIVCMNTNPSEALSYFICSQNFFISKHNLFGELLVLNQIIFFHFAVDNKRPQDRSLAITAENIFSKIRSKIDKHAEIQSLIAIAQGYCWFENNFEQSFHYSLTALQIAEKFDFKNYVATSRIARFYCFAFQGQWENCHAEIEACSELLSSPRVNSFHKHTILFMNIDLLGAEGDFINFDYQKAKLIENSESKILLNSVFGPGIMLRSVDRYVAEGQYEEAIQLANKAIIDYKLINTPHMSSQFVQYIALANALLGNTENAIASATVAEIQRDNVGVDAYIAFNRLILGATYILLKQYDIGINFLNEALDISKKMNEFMLRSGIFSYRAYAMLETNRTKNAINNIQSAMHYLSKHKYRHFFGWNPIIMTAIFSKAVHLNIQSKYAQKLAAERLGIAISDRGTILPLLHIKTLGNFQIEVEGITIIRENNITPSQRQLLALLLASSDFQISTNQLQLALWPESNAIKGRNKLDTLISRFRAALKVSLKNIPLHYYLKLEKGILSLNHCTCDARAFLTHVQNGFYHAQNKNFYQANNSFFIAHQLWNGEFMPDTAVNGSPYEYRLKVFNFFIESAICWSRILMNRQKFEEALTIIMEALKYDTINHSLNILSYECYARLNNPRKAANVIRSYRELLSHEGFTPVEVEEIIESFWTD